MSKGKKVKEGVRDVSPRIRLLWSVNSTVLSVGYFFVIVRREVGIEVSF
jgi:hypothetical protein